MDALPLGPERTLTQVLAKRCSPVGDWLDGGGEGGGVMGAGRAGRVAESAVAGRREWLATGEEVTAGDSAGGLGARTGTFAGGTI